jgi:hypothetical protein
MDRTSPHTHQDKRSARQILPFGFILGLDSSACTHLERNRRWMSGPSRSIVSQQDFFGEDAEAQRTQSGKDLGRFARAGRHSVRNAILAVSASSAALRPPQKNSCLPGDELRGTASSRRSGGSTKILTESDGDSCRARPEDLHQHAPGQITQDSSCDRCWARPEHDAERAIPTPCEGLS